VATEGRPGRAYDWADLAVPLLASIGRVIKAGNPDPVIIVGTGIGYALWVALCFCGVRRLLRAMGRPGGRPLPAAVIGLSVWAFIIFRR
jgi:hypothetical protein